MTTCMLKYLAIHAYTFRVVILYINFIDLLGGHFAQFLVCQGEHYVHGTAEIADICIIPREERKSQPGHHRIRS